MLNGANVWMQIFAPKVVFLEEKNDEFLFILF